MQACGHIHGKPSAFVEAELAAVGWVLVCSSWHMPLQRQHSCAKQLHDIYYNSTANSHCCPFRKSIDLTQSACLKDSLDPMTMQQHACHALPLATAALCITLATHCLHTSLQRLVCTSTLEGLVHASSTLAMALAA